MDKIRDLGIVEQKAYELRLRKNLTQKEFAKVIGISKDYLSNMENGHRTMNIYHINKICNGFEVSFDYMFGFCKEINQNIIKIESINLKSLGKNIRKIRKELKYTQQKMADKLGISRPQITLYEKGIRTVKPDDLKQICEIGGYSADWCVGKLSECIKYKPVKKIKAKEIRDLINS